MQEPAAAETEIEEAPEVPDEPVVEEPTGESEETQAPEAEGESEAAPEEPAAEQKEPEAEPVQSPEELAAELKKEKARRFYLERQLAKDQKAQPEAPAPVVATERPNADDFEDYEEYNDALMDWKIDQREAARAAQADKLKAEEKFKAFNKKMAQGAEAHPDFVEVVTNPDLPITLTMQSAIVECEHSHEVAYYLGQNPMEAFDISGKDPVSAAIAIAKIDAKISSSKPAQRTETNAPGPTKPLSGDGTIKKDMNDWTTEEWVRNRNAAEGLE